MDDLKTKIILILLPPRQGLISRPVYVGFMVCKVANGQVVVYNNYCGGVCQYLTPLLNSRCKQYFPLNVGTKLHGVTFQKAGRFTKRNTECRCSISLRQRLYPLLPLRYVLYIIVYVLHNARRSLTHSLSLSEMIGSRLCPTHTLR